MVALLRRPSPQRLVSRFVNGALLVLSAAVLALPAAAQAVKTTLTSSDGQPVVGGWTKSGLDTTKGAVILVPNVGGSRWAFELAVPKLSKAGFGVFALDPRGHGDSAKDKDGKPIATEGAAAFSAGALDVETACRHLEGLGIPRTRIAVLGAGTGCLTTLVHAAAHADHPKALLFLSPPLDDRGIGAAAVAKTVRKRAVLVTGSIDEAARGVAAWKDAFGHDLVHVLPTTSASGGAALFGKSGTFDTSLVEWLDASLSVPDPVTIPGCRTVLLDGDVRAAEVGEGLFVDIPGSAGTTKVRVTHADGRLDIGFDVPERYVRQNEVMVFLDAHAEPPRLAGPKSFMVSFSPKNSARKPLIVSNGSPKGWEESNVIGVMAYAVTDDPKRWTAELSIDLKRFFPDGLDKGARIAFGVGGQKSGDRRWWPASPAVPDVPKTWAPFSLK